MKPMLALFDVFSLDFIRRNEIIRNKQLKISEIKMLIAIEENMVILFDFTMNTVKKAIIPERIKNSSASAAEGMRIFL